MSELSSHFEFGRNWSSYAGLIDEERVAEAVRGLERLAGPGGLAGKTFLDIGCGSGLHSLAALRLGAARIVAIDLDPHSVATTRQVLERYTAEAAEQSGGQSDKPWEVREVSVFDLPSQNLGQFDVVYAWGSLHHTGDMYKAWRTAAGMVAPGGTLNVALYRKTRLCWLWTIEKFLYTHSPRWVQKCLRAVFICAMRLAFLVTGRDFQKYRDDYAKSFRGMDYEHDVHDWMGGYPYESVSPRQADAFRQELGFETVRNFVLNRTPVGIFGSGNDEFVWRRPRS
ncbi:MAG: methyltransferase domain-containing protein [Planctomycetes bacterium]|nr:methyltransferase domain-containing protein [Planctomycetota bacterium]